MQSGFHEDGSSLSSLVWMVICAAFLAIMCCACTTLKPTEHATLREGDEIFITARNGDTHAFAITAISPAEICGKVRCVRTDDVGVIEKREFSAVKTTVLVVVIVAVVVLYAYASATASLMSWQ
jgi:hypothetical protein